MENLAEQIFNRADIGLLAHPKGKPDFVLPWEQRLNKTPEAWIWMLLDQEETMLQLWRMELVWYYRAAEALRVLDLLFPISH